MISTENFYVVRIPLLPVDFTDQLQQLTPQTMAPAMKNIFKDASLQNAIYIASPELYQELSKWQQGVFLQEKDIHKLSAALYRYLLRMSSRCTPYGLFAGCATGAPGQHTHIALQPVTAHYQHCRLDMNYVAELAAAITAIPAIREQLAFFPNNAIYRSGNRYRYAAYNIKNKFRNYYLTAVNASAYLTVILERAAGGATLMDLRNSIVSETENITVEEAGVFVEELIQQQLLVSELEPTVTGEEFFTYFVDRLAALEHSGEIVALLRQIQSLLQTPGIDSYIRIHQIVKSMLQETSSKDLLQTDLFLATTGNQISRQVIDDLIAQTAQLLKLARSGFSNDLQDFCTAFNARYEEQEIPLTWALDVESGIGYGGRAGGSDHAPLVDDLRITPKNKHETIVRSKWLDFQQEQLKACLQAQEMEINISEIQLEALKEPDTPVLPASMYLMGKLMGSSATAIDEGDYLFDMSGCSGPSAANLLGRFCHGDERLHQQVQTMLRAEEAQAPERIFAEIVHLPESRTGNILLRPRLRPYEIVYLANSHTPAEYQLPVTDLMVSVRQGRVVLRSAKLNKIIVPRLSTAHNFRNGLPVYRFLCDLQFQEYNTGFSWHWQLPTPQDFLPRVKFGKIILSKCTWLLRKKDFPQLKDRSAFAAVRRQRKLPRYVVIVEGDNELLIDLDNEASLQLLLDALQKSEQLTLQEFLQTPDRCWIEGPAGKHANELILPLRHMAARVASPAQPVPENRIPQRQFITGSEWLYVKLYCGTRSAEDVLKAVIRPLTRRWIDEQVIDHWFFIRYTDPEHHIRVRFHQGVHPDFWKTVLEQLYENVGQFEGNALIHRIQTDTYERELERYGLSTMALSEHIFYYDSECVLDLINLLDEDSGETYRWMLGLRGIDSLLDAFDYTLEEKAKYLKYLQQGFFQEFGGDKPLLVQLNDKYRQETRQIYNILNPAVDKENGVEEGVALLEQRTARIRQAVAKEPPFQKDQLLGSYIHMFLNRLLLSNQRKHELVMYHFLSRYYESRMAILRQNNQTDRTISDN
ncbi:lantibiotic dehydratase [Chitinophaga sp. 30R24]|uniref:lantibiotic dehydratase n=1 Tax=Chitinophaga sp. 30R24 TaxID=3248838 RepID=UPI003B9014EC